MIFIAGCPGPRSLNSQLACLGDPLPLCWPTPGLSPIRTLLLKTAVGECLIADVLIDSDRYRQSACGRVTALTFTQSPCKASAAISGIRLPARSSALQP